MKLYLLKTGYDCCPDGDWVVGLFTDLNKLREAICITADKLWAYEHISVTYVLRPSSPEERTPLVSELFGEEVYHYELPPELQAIK